VSEELRSTEVPSLNALHATGVDIGESGSVSYQNATVRASGRYVPVGDRLVPDWLEMTTEGDAGGPTCEARVEVRDGAPRVVHLSFTAGNGYGEIQQKHLRRVQVDALVELLAGFSVQVIDEAPGNGYVVLGIDDEVRALALRSLQEQRGRRRLTPQLLRQVADVYLTNPAAPTKAVRERFFVSMRQATNYVQAAEAAGFLPPTTRGKKRV
jgi:hypothetical protein